MKGIVLAVIITIMAGCGADAAKPYTLESNRESVARILNELPECKAAESKIIFSIRDRYYLIIVNDKSYSEYFVVLDTLSNELERTPVKVDPKRRKTKAKFFKNFEYLSYLDQDNIGSAATFGHPAYFALVNGDQIVKDSVFFSVSLPNPLPIDLLVYLNKEIFKEISRWQEKHNVTVL